MKNIKLLLFVLLTVTLSLKAQEEKVIYSGNFDGLRCRGLATFKLIPSDSNYVTMLAADEELQEYISIAKQGSVLNIDVIKKNANLSKLLDKLIIKVYFVDIEHLVMEGAGKLETVGPIMSERLIAAIRGTCVVDLEVECVDFEVNIAGTSELTVAGTSKHALVNVEGIGSYKGEGLESELVDIKLEGVGYAVVNATYELKAHLSGVGTIEYLGDPREKDLDVDGVGSIRKRE